MGSSGGCTKQAALPAMVRQCRGGAGSACRTRGRGCTSTPRGSSASPWSSGRQGPRGLRRRRELQRFLGGARQVELEPLRRRGGDLQVQGGPRGLLLVRQGGSPRQPRGGRRQELHGRRLKGRFEVVQNN